MLTSAALTANAVGWPAGYEGVMLQSFHWEEDETPAEQLDIRWKDMTNRVDEFAPYFDLIWVPNSGKGNSTLGYLPVYWFTNHNTKMGTEDELLEMIKTYKDRGTGFIADVIVNHRSTIGEGEEGWYSYPSEEWDGRTWSMGINDIVCDDELFTQYPDLSTTANADEGCWPGEATLPCTYCRDLDHQGANVQESSRNYMRCLYEKYGYVGRRYDYMRGFDARRITDFNHYMRATHPEQPTFSVGEFWDSSYDRVQQWIEATGRESAAFDFPFKYALMAAFDGDDDMTKLVWNANGTTPQPAGMIHYGYAQYAVTFIDNHDSYRDEFNEGNNFKDTEHIPAANAFMICSPGTPCVFINHWTAYKEQIMKMIEARKAAGVSNTSKVTVLRTNQSCYMAEVIGSKGRLVVKIGSEMVSPDASLGYGTEYCSGKDYCIWVKTNGGEAATGESGNLNVPSGLYVVGTLKDAHWVTNKGIRFTKSSHKFTATDVELTAADDGKAYFTFTTLSKSSWDDVNSSDRFGAPNKDEAITADATYYMKQYFAGWNAAAASSWMVEPGVYDIEADFDYMTVKLTRTGDVTVDPDPTPDPTPDPEPETLKVYYDNSESNWSTPYIYYWGGASSPSWPGVSMTKYEGNIWVYTLPENTTGCLFNAGDGNATQTGDFTVVNNHVYTQTGDQSTSTPTNVYIVGNYGGSSDKWWNITSPTKYTSKDDRTYTWTEFTIDNADNGYGYFSFITNYSSSTDWDTTVNDADRYGSTYSNRPLELMKPAFVQKYAKGVNASSAQSWKVEAGTYNIVLNLDNNSVSIYKPLKETHLVFREDDDDWLVNGKVPSATEGADNAYLTIRFGDVDDNDFNAAWGYMPTATMRYQNPGAANAPRRAAGTIPGQNETLDIDDAPVLLDVSIELENTTNRQWYVINSKYEGWSWDEADHDGQTPDDFYINQVLDFPTAPGYIRVPLIAENNHVTATATPNDKVGLYSGEPVTTTKTYSFAAGGTTSVDVADETADDAEPVYYNLQGIRVANPGTGVYIKVQGRKVSKITIR